MERLRVLRLPAVSAGNPYQRELYDRLRGHGIDLLPAESVTPVRLLRRRGQIDVLHFHWRLDRLYRLADDGLGGGRERAYPAPVAALRLARLAVTLRLARALGIRVAWTVHEPWNCRPGARRLDHLAGRLVARAADVLMAHDHASAELTRRFLRPRRPVAVLPLPSYADTTPRARPGARERVRSELGVADGDVLALALGVLRPEKELDLLAAALRRLDAPRLRVLVVGQSRSEAVVAMLHAAAARDDRLTVQVGWVTDQRVSDLFAGADVSVLGRSVEWTGASPVLSLSLGVPVVAARLGSTTELLGPGAWYFEPGDAESLAARLAEAAAASPAERAARGAAGQAHVARWDFDDLATATALALRGAEALVPARTAAELAPA